MASRFLPYFFWDHVPIASPGCTWGIWVFIERLPVPPHRIFGDSALTPPSFPLLILWVTMAQVRLGGSPFFKGAIVLTWNRQANRLSSFLSLI